MVYNPKILFCVFYVDVFSTINKTNEKDSFNILNEYKIIDYLVNNYDILHTQGKDYVMYDIISMLIERGYYEKRTKVSDLLEGFEAFESLEFKENVI